MGCAGILFTPVIQMVGVVAGEKACPGCISKTVRCKMLIFGGTLIGGVCGQLHGMILI